MPQKNSLKPILKFSLVITIPLLILLAQKHALALKEKTPLQSELKKIRKPKLRKSTLEQRMAWLEMTTKDRMKKLAQDLHLEKNKSKISLVIYKKERLVELWKRDKKNKLIKTYNMTEFSGKLGPKSREGDYQIPEGIYRASSLNPNSQYYLSIGLNYPNENDKARGRANKVKKLGGDIFIHGRNETIGCVPIGDHWIEEVFYIVAKVGLLNTRIVIAPTRLPLPSLKELSLDEKDTLLIEKYSQLAQELKSYSVGTAQ